METTMLQGTYINIYCTEHGAICKDVYIIFPEYMDNEIPEIYDLIEETFEKCKNEDLETTKNKISDILIVNNIDFLTIK